MSTIAVVAVPLSQKPHNENATSIITVWVIRRMRLRGRRSASEPASGPTASAGTKFTKAATPTQSVECVSWSIT